MAARPLYALCEPGSSDPIGKDVLRLTTASAEAQGPIVRRLAGQGDRAVGRVALLLESESARVLRSAVCALKLIGTPAARAALRCALLASLDRKRVLRARTFRRRVVAAVAGVSAAAATALLLACYLFLDGTPSDLIPLVMVIGGILPIIVLAAGLCVGVAVADRTGAAEPTQVPAGDSAEGALLAACLRGCPSEQGSLMAGLDTSAVGLFVSLLNERRDVRGAAEMALIQLLPTIGESNSPCLDAEEMENLVRRIGGRNRKLTIAILKALPYVGDARALPMVRSLAQDRFPGWDPYVYEAAIECLPLLTARVEKQRQSQTLLRPAESPDSVTLLRPATATESVAEHLLRPASKG